MKIRPLLILAVVVVVVAGALARYGASETAAPTGVDGFETLDEAVAFLAHCIEQDDRAILAAACRGDVDSVPAYVMTSLAGTHSRTPLPDLYADRTFPTDTDTFKLGGHASELGYIHIDFVRRSGCWFLESLWMCR